MPKSIKALIKKANKKYKKQLQFLKSSLPWFVFRTITPLQLRSYKRYVTALMLVEHGYSRRFVSGLFNIERKQLYLWLRGIQKSVVEHHILFLKRNKVRQKNEMLLPFGRKPSSHILLNSTWYMPMKISKFKDVKNIVSQLLGRRPSSIELEEFGFLIGYYLSDGAHQQRLRNGRLGTHGFECGVAKTKGNAALLRYIKRILENYGFVVRIIESKRRDKPHELLLYTNRSFFFDYLRYVIIGVPDGFQKTYSIPTNIVWILKSPPSFQEFVFKGLFEGDGEVKGPSGTLGIWAAPMTDFVSRLCYNLGLNTKVYGPKIIFRLNRESIDRLQELCFLQNIVSEKRRDILLWKQKLRALKYIGQPIRKKLRYSIIRQYKNSKITAYGLARNNGLAQTTVISILKKIGRW